MLGGKLVAFVGNTLRRSVYFHVFYSLQAVDGGS